MSLNNVNQTITGYQIIMQNKFLTSTARITDAYMQMYRQSARVNESTDGCCGSNCKTLGHVPAGRKVVKGEMSSKTGSKLGVRKILPFEKRDKSSCAGCRPPLKKNEQFRKITNNWISRGGKEFSAGLKDNLGVRKVLPFEKRDERPTSIGRINGVKDVSKVSKVRGVHESVKRDKPLIDPEVFRAFLEREKKRVAEKFKELGIETKEEWIDAFIKKNGFPPDYEDIPYIYGGPRYRPMRESDNTDSEYEDGIEDDEAVEDDVSTKKDELLDLVLTTFEQIYDNLSDDDKETVDEVKDEIESVLNPEDDEDDEDDEEIDGDFDDDDDDEDIGESVVNEASPTSKIAKGMGAGAKGTSKSASAVSKSSKAVNKGGKAASTGGKSVARGAGASTKVGKAAKPPKKSGKLKDLITPKEPLKGATRGAGEIGLNYIPRDILAKAAEMVKNNKFLTIGAALAALGYAGYEHFFDNDGKKQNVGNDLTAKVDTQKTAEGIKLVDEKGKLIDTKRKISTTGSDNSVTDAETQALLQRKKDEDDYHRLAAVGERLGNKAHGINNGSGSSFADGAKAVARMPGDIITGAVDSVKGLFGLNTSEMNAREHQNKLDIERRKAELEQDYEQAKKMKELESGAKVDTSKTDGVADTTKTDTKEEKTVVKPTATTTTQTTTDTTTQPTTTNGDEEQKK